MVDHLFIFEDGGKIKDYNGKYQEYRAELVAKKLSGYENNNGTVLTPNASNMSVENDRKLSFDERKELARLEKEIQKLGAKRNDISAAFNDIASLTPDRIKQLSKDLDAIGEQIEEKEMRWLELAEFA